jgi:hypothetical protein
MTYEQLIECKEKRKPVYIKNSYTFRNKKTFITEVRENISLGGVVHVEGGDQSYEGFRVILAELTPREFLESKGIDLNTTALFCAMEGFVRQPDLCILLEQYYEEKSKSNQVVYEDKRVPFNANV